MVSESWEAWLCYLGVGEGRQGRREDSETWGRLTRVLDCKTPGKFEILKGLEEKPNCHCFSVVLLAMGAGHGMCGVTSLGPSQGGAVRCGSQGLSNTNLHRRQGLEPAHTKLSQHRQTFCRKHSSLQQEQMVGQHWVVWRASWRRATQPDLEARVGFREVRKGGHPVSGYRGSQALRPYRWD